MRHHRSRSVCPDQGVPPAPCDGSGVGILTRYQTRGGIGRGRIGHSRCGRRAQHRRFPNRSMAGSGVDRSWADSSTSTRRQVETAGQVPWPRFGTRHPGCAPLASATGQRGDPEVDHPVADARRAGSRDPSRPRSGRTRRPATTGLLQRRRPLGFRKLTASAPRARYLFDIGAHGASGEPGRHARHPSNVSDTETAVHSRAHCERRGGQWRRDLMAIEHASPATVTGILRR